MSKIRQNLESVRKRIASSAAACRRDPSSVKLVAVSKTQTAEAIREAFEAGQRVFGENYAQELRDKAASLSNLEIEWHYIGHLQRNKAKYVAPVAACVESVDSLELAEAMSRRAGRRIGCLIEVNIGAEKTKSGVEPSSVEELARGIASLPNLELRGLMVIPPFEPDGEKSRPYFRNLRELLAKTNEALAPIRMTDLSMGMSHDFEVAIEEGATIVRVGTAIFGERQ
ncbi:MAG TPA: YggS family pyridoxal phosphate-dependent enzyme [bacterium]|nr:YggS family pyridoxal phosphate-dependent enzyme [bacterium]